MLRLVRYVKLRRIVLENICITLEFSYHSCSNEMNICVRKIISGISHLLGVILFIASVHIIFHNCNTELFMRLTEY